MRREVATWGHHNSPRSTAIIACNHTFDSHGRVDSHPRPFGDGHGCVRYVSLGKWSKYNIHKPFWRADSLLPWLDTSCSSSGPKKSLPRCEPRNSFGALVATCASYAAEWETSSIAASGGHTGLAHGLNPVSPKETIGLDLDTQGDTEHSILAL